MIEIGSLKDIRRYSEEGMQISEILAEERRNKVYTVFAPVEVDAGAATQTVMLGAIPFDTWKVIGYGAICTEAGTTAEAILLHFGLVADVDAIGIVTFTQTSPTVVAVGNNFSEDAAGILPADSLAAGVSVAHTNGNPDAYNVWQTGTKMLTLKTVTTLTSGKFVGFAVIEVEDTGKY